MNFLIPEIVSKKAQNFILKFLVRDPKKRISIEEGLMHPFML
jgi:serine/threonine protein kinase